MRNLLMMTVFAGALCGCGGSGGGYSGLAKSRDRWDKQRPAHYSYRYVATGYVGDAGVPWTIEVVDPNVTSVTFAGEGVAPSSGLTIASAPTIDALFGRIQKALDDSQDVIAAYDSTAGYPTEVSITRGSESDGFTASDLETK